MDKSKILIIEDQLIPAYDIRRQLSQTGYQVVGVYTEAEEALVFLMTAKGTDSFPEVIITDISLSGKMNGIEASRIIYDQYDCAVLFLTGLSQMKVVEETLKSKPALFLMKPFDITNAHILIQMALQQRSLELENKRLKEELRIYKRAY